MPFVFRLTQKVHASASAKKRLSLFIILSVPLLTACSHDTTTPHAASLATQAPLPVSSASNTDIEALLNAEFILQREGPNKAFESFYALASQSNNIDLIERLTHIALLSQNHLYIERSANLWLAAAPSSETAYSLKLQILIKDNRAEEVATLLINAMRHKVSLRFLPLYLEENIRENDQVSTIEEAISLLPMENQNNPNIQLSHAHLLLLSGKYQQAITTSEQLLSKDGMTKNEALYLILTFSQKNLDLLEDAIKTLKTALIQQPKSTRLLTPLIDFFVDDNQPTSAVDIYQTAALDTPEKLQVGINLMRTLLEHQHAELALQIASSLPQKQLGLSDQINYLTAIALAQLGQKPQAIDTMEKVDGTLRANATNQLAIWFYEEGKEQDINTMVLRRTPRENMPEQVAAISHLHEEKGQTDLSYELVNNALVNLPESAPLRYRKALLADTLGYWDITESELKTLLQKDSDNPQYLNALGYTLLTRTDRLDEAMRYIESAYDKNNEDPAIIDSLGWGFFLKGELEQSSYYLKKAWSILPDAEIAAHYGESLWKQRHYKEALSIWKTALETAPDTPLLLDTIKRLSPSLLEDLTQDKP